MYISILKTGGKIGNLLAGASVMIFARKFILLSADGDFNLNMHFYHVIFTHEFTAGFPNWI